MSRLLYPCPHTGAPHAHRSLKQVRLCGYFAAGYRLSPDHTGFEPIDELLDGLVAPDGSGPPEQLDLFGAPTTSRT